MRLTYPMAALAVAIASPAYSQFDVTRTFEVELVASEHVRASAAGDFDGDAMTDVVFAQDTAVCLVFGPSLYRASHRFDEAFISIATLGGTAVNGRDELLATTAAGLERLTISTTGATPTLTRQVVISSPEWQNAKGLVVHQSGGPLSYRISAVQADGSRVSRAVYQGGVFVPSPVPNLLAPAPIRDLLMLDLFGDGTTEIAALTTAGLAISSFDGVPILWAPYQDNTGHAVVMRQGGPASKIGWIRQESGGAFGVLVGAGGIEGTPMDLGTAVPTAVIAGTLDADSLQDLLFLDVGAGVADIGFAASGYDFATSITLPTGTDGRGGLLFDGDGDRDSELLVPDPVSSTVTYFRGTSLDDPNETPSVDLTTIPSETNSVLANMSTYRFPPEDGETESSWSLEFEIAGLDAAPGDATHLEVMTFYCLLEDDDPTQGLVEGVIDPVPTFRNIEPLSSFASDGTSFHIPVYTEGTDTKGIEYLVIRYVTIPAETPGRVSRTWPSFVFGVYDSDYATEAERFLEIPTTYLIDEGDSPTQSLPISTLLPGREQSGGDPIPDLPPLEDPPVNTGGEEDDDEAGGTGSAG